MMTLSVISYIERINRVYRLVRMERTGSRDELAAKLRVSRRTVNNYLEELRLMGAEIRFRDATRITLPISSYCTRRLKPVSMPTYWISLTKKRIIYTIYNKH
mgnify:CR=1 FL=1